MDVSLFKGIHRIIRDADLISVRWDMAKPVGFFQVTAEINSPGSYKSVFDIFPLNDIHIITTFLIFLFSSLQTATYRCLNPDRP